MDHPTMPGKVKDCQEILGYQFNDHHLCCEALQTAGNGVTFSGTRRIPNGSKRLAILGDFVLGLLLSQEWYRGGKPEGTWDKIRQSVISNANLGSLGTDKGLDRCVQLGNGQSAVSTKMMATTVEALVGAAYLDSGEGGIAAAGGIAQNLGIAYQRPAV